MTADLFATVTPEVLRNGRGQPMIVPPEGGKSIPYNRASAFANTLDDAGGLATWRVRYAALGIARNPDLAMMAGALSYGDKELDEIIETAHDRMGGNEKANYGTAIHSYTDPRDDTYVPDVMAADVDAYRTALADHGITIESTSAFIVNDALKVAGTYDNVLRMFDGRLVMSDKKTGTLHLLACSLQLAIYAGGVRYGVDEDGNPVRTPLGVDQDTAIVAHIPKGTGTCDLYEVDLNLARERCAMALAVRQARKDKDIGRLLTAPAAAHCPMCMTPKPCECAAKDAAKVAANKAATADAIAEQIATATTIEGLTYVWTTCQNNWTDEHSALASARKTLILANAV